MSAEADTSDSQTRSKICDMQKLIVVQSCCVSLDFCWSSLCCFLPQKKELVLLLEQVDFTSLSVSIYLFYGGLIMLLLERNEI